MSVTVAGGEVRSLKEISMNEDWKRFFKLREKVFNKIKEVDEGYHKSYEGAMDVTF